MALLSYLLKMIRRGWHISVYPGSWLLTEKFWGIQHPLKSVWKP